MRSKEETAGSMSRRSLLLAGSAALGSVMLPPNLMAAGGLDLDDQWDRLTALVKLRGSLDGSMVMWWMKGVRFGVVDDIVTPMFGMLIGSFQTVKPMPGKGFQLNMLEMSYFTDLETGAVLETFTNPYNGKVCQVPEQRLGPYPVLLSPTGVVLPNVPPFDKVELQTRGGPDIVNGDDVWIRDDSTIKVDSDHPMMGKHTYNELVTYHGKLSDINNTDMPSAPADIMFQSVTSWRDWLQAEDVGGHTTARATGKKISRLEEFPPEYLVAARKYHPEIIADPEAVLAAPPPPPAGGHDG